ncbi:MAG: carboxypeptidase regulatory-like domain-containing protein [Bacteroidia bacterium]
MNKKMLLSALLLGLFCTIIQFGYAQEDPERKSGSDSDDDTSPRNESVRTAPRDGFNQVGRPGGRPQGAASGTTRELKGLVYDEDTGRPLDAVEVVFRDSTKSYTGSTQEDGSFAINKVPFGRKQLTLVREGYEPLFIPDFLVAGGEKQALSLTMRQLIAIPDSGEFDLDSVVISTEKYRQLSGVSTRTFTIEETRRYAASYFDPARLAESYPGVVNANDQANNISIRGNSPNGLQWRLEGVEIVNPNHLTNAGVASDRPTLRGGGVNILSAQMMASSTFQTGAFDSRYGNALGGVMDINLRKGQTDRDYYTMQFGLIGLDIAAEGPVGEGEKAAFLGNYRYSTVGLLDALGVDVGDEAINFQDLSFHVTMPNTLIGEVNIFGMGGKSKNSYQGDSVQYANEIKERYDIDYTNRMGALGLTHKVLLGSKAVWRSTIAISGAEATRQALYKDTLDSRFDISETLKEDDLYSETRLAIRSSLLRKLGGSGSLELGGYATRIGFNLNSLYQSPQDTASFIRPRTAVSGHTWLFQPFARLKRRIGRRLDIEVGLHAMALDLNSDFVIEPRTRARLQLGKKHAVAVAYGLHSQMQPLSLYFSPVPRGDDTTYINRNLGFTRAHHAVLSYSFRFNPSLSLKVEPYAQLLFDVPIINRPTSNVSALNLLEEVVEDTFTNAGTGRNYGLELSLEKTLNKDYYFLMSASYYNSTYVAGDGEEYDTRFNGNYAIALTGGKEFIRNKEEHQGIWAIDTRIFAQGGQRVKRIDDVASRAAGRTVYIESFGWSDQLDDYLRVDIRISHTRHKANYTRTFAIDIQNVLDRENIGWQYFDPLLGETVTKYQLGRIPMLTYRVSF